MRKVTALSFVAGMILLTAGPATAAHRPAGNVPPTLEIEVLDPGVDPSGNPAVVLRRDPCGQLQVDIPPVILVHRYYYSGDRSFQAQILPGGPSIVVANHPKTGERCYIPAQILPGAPRVTYTSKSIEYDYGDNGITVHFPSKGTPSIKYRSGTPFHRKVANAVHAEHWKEGASKLKQHTVDAAKRGGTCAYGAVVEVKDTGKTILLPATNIVRSLPFAAPLFSTDWEQRLATTAAEHKRDHANKKAQKEAERRQFSIRTNY